MEGLTEGFLAIPVQSSAFISFIDSPENFYLTLQEKIAKSEHRIILSALYLGTGKLEKRLVQSVDKRKREKPEILMGILLDYFRGTRANECGQSSVDVLRDLCANCQVNLFYHPDMTGKLKTLLPKRFNEVIGLQHMKFFVFDDSVIISGANLSEIYFTNRQDRYMIVENCPILADLFTAIFETISSCSLTLRQSGDIEFCFDTENSHLHPITGDTQRLRISLQERLRKVFANCKEKIKNAILEDSSPVDTFLYPFLQMGSFHVNDELTLLTRLFQRKEFDNYKITISTGYFNLYEEYADLISKRSWLNTLEILFASPQANGFYNANGLAGYIPSLYVQNSLEFLQRCEGAAANGSVFLAEYVRPEWTFHAKGIWLFQNHDISPNSIRPPVATIVGSSNFGYRSVNRDLEAQVLLITTNEVLSKKINDERKSIARHCKRLDSSTFALQDHFVPLWVRYFSRVFRHFF